MKKLLLLSFLLPLMLLSCRASSDDRKGLKGDKNIVKKEFTISEYDRIVLNSSYNVVYEQRDSPTSVLTVELDENLMSYVEAKVKDKKLYLNLKDGFNIKPTKFVIYTNSADLKNVTLSGAGNFKANKKVKLDNLKIELSGAGNINFDDLEVQTIDCGLRGAGNISLAGKAVSADFKVSGAGNIKANDFVTQDAKCSVSGVGNVNVRTLGKLDARVSGVGNINYTGEPKKLTKSQTGMGKVRKKD